MRPRMNDLVMEAGDRLVQKTGTGEILGLKEDGQIAFRERGGHDVETGFSRPFEHGFGRDDSFRRSSQGYRSGV